MANNCLVTKLKGVVNNNNLPILGKIVIPVKKAYSDANNGVIISRVGGNVNSQPVKLYCAVGSFEYNGTVYGNTVNRSDNLPLVCVLSADGNIIIDKYNLQWLSFIALDGNNNYDGKTPNGYVFNLEDIEYCTNLIDFKMQRCPMKGTYMNLSKLVNIQNLELCNVEGMSISFDIIKLAQEWIKNGRATGSINISADTCYFNTTKINSKYFFGGRPFKWESASKMWLTASGTEIWYVGYTSGEVATKTAAGGEWEGKTPINCG